MRNDKHLAINLRKKGKSYRKIANDLGIPKSTLSNWFTDLRWSRKIKEDLSRKARYTSRRKFLSIVKKQSNEWENKRKNSRNEAREVFSLLLKNPLFISGINIYWGEGDSKMENGNLRISNTDSKMIVVFIRFLKEILKIPENKIRIGIIIYPDIDENKCLDFWQNITQIPFSQFYKTQVIRGKHPTKRSEQGICMVSVCDRMAKEKVGVWIKMFGKKYSRV